MPKTDLQKWRLEALTLVLENMPERVRLQPWSMADNIVAYLRTGDKDNVPDSIKRRGEK